jgi:NADH-quinone oxidoreductase subunit J
MLHPILFFLFAALCVGGAINLLVQKHPINSALSLIVVMASLALIYLLLGAEFVAAVQVIVYAGAIMVLFVFTIMLLNAGEEERSSGSRIAAVLGIPALAVAIGLGLYVTSTPGYPHAVARPLFREFLLPFEVTSVLILIAIMGAVVLAKRSE